MLYKVRNQGYISLAFDERVKMDFDVLKSFLVVAREENITRASELLNISQPSLSRQIQNLEEEFGAKLFTRNRKKTVLTTQGMVLQKRATELLDMYRKTQIEIQSEPEIITGDIRFASIYAPSLDKILELGKLMAEEHPGIRLLVSNGDMYAVRELVYSGQVDLGLVYAMKHGDDMFDRIEIQENMNVGVLLPADHPLASKEVIRFEDLRPYPMVVHERFLGTPIPGRQEIDQGKYNICGTYTTPVGAGLMVNSGYGIALVSESNISFNYGNIVYRNIMQNTNLSTYLIWKKDSAMPIQSSFFLKRIKEYFNGQ